MKRLLLVDDDAAFLKILSSLLQRDFQVYEVSITLKFCTFFTLKKCTDITVFFL